MTDPTQPTPQPLPASGWYDDPQDPANLRYWDGVAWTAHVTPKQSPTLGQSTIGQAPPVPASAARPASGGYASQQPYQAYPSYQGYQAGDEEETWLTPTHLTPDGVPLATWGKRLGAWVLDGVIITAISTPFTARYWGTLVDQMSRISENPKMSQAQVQQIQSDIAGASIPMSLITFLVATIYCLIFWTRGSAQTPGKRMLGISVRNRERPGPLTIGEALKRRVVPLIGLVIGLVPLLDGLWPLWDSKRQALHDKVAGTVVVVGKQQQR